ncbi:uncharacterized protein B0H64DRAFT_316477 [Chaetomium fimeti]|uniref:C2H2-type domain-containing protein n=1 Tax=Chaetomium fimeti TaxID=1854472 RepID=A0AAE0LVV3_9PEZI|nr:hypothetical protein B0H64DRAFT_316477 [Chaetomium fimeti]
MSDPNADNTGIDPDFDARFSDLAMSTDANADPPPFWPDQDASLSAQPATAGFGTAQPPDFTDPLVDQTNAHQQPVDYAQYPDDTTSQPYWLPDSGPAQAGPSSGAVAADKPFVCGVEGCTKSYDRQCDLDKHVNNHTKRRRCDICGVGGAENKDLNRHMWTHHSDEARRRGLPKEEDWCSCGYSGRKDNVKRHKDTLGHI